MPDIESGVTFEYVIFDGRVPGPIKLLHHALSRVAYKSFLGVIDVEGEPEPDTYDPDP